MVNNYKQSGSRILPPQKIEDSWKKTKSNFVLHNLPVELRKKNQWREF